MIIESVTKAQYSKERLPYDRMIEFHFCKLSLELRHSAFPPLLTAFNKEVFSDNSEGANLVPFALLLKTKALS